MPTKHIENNTKAPMYVGGKMIPPGSGRDIDVALLPPEHQTHAAVVDQSGPSVAELIESLRAKPVKEILADLEGLTQEALGLLHEAERAQAKPRTSLIAGLEAEVLARADARVNPLKVAQIALNHTSLKSTGIYLDMSREEYESELRMVDGGRVPKKVARQMAVGVAA